MNPKCQCKHCPPNKTPRQRPVTPPCKPRPGELTSRALAWVAIFLLCLSFVLILPGLDQDAHAVTLLTSMGLSMLVAFLGGVAAAQSAHDAKYEQPKKH